MISAQMLCNVHRRMLFCFYFKNHLNFPNLNVKTHFLQTLKVAFFLKKVKKNTFYPL